MILCLPSGGTTHFYCWRKHCHSGFRTIFGNGEQVRAFSYIDDVAPIIARGHLNLRARNEIFNVGADVPYTATGLFELLGIDEDSRSTKAYGFSTRWYDRFMRQAISRKMHSQFRIIGSVLCWFRCLQHPPLALLCKVFWFLIGPQDTFSDIRIWMNLLPKKLQLCPFPAFWDCQRSQFWGKWVGLCCCRGCECYWTSYRFSTSAVGSGGGSLQSRQGILRERALEFVSEKAEDVIKVR